MTTESIPVGSWFPNREELRLSGLHKHSMAGIASTNGLAEAVVLSGGYKEDEDFGTRVILTGQGGQSAPGSGIQVADQELEKGNLGLVNAAVAQSPVRLIRGSGGDKTFSRPRDTDTTDCFH